MRRDWASNLVTGEENEAKEESLVQGHIGGTAGIKAHRPPSGLGSNDTSSVNSYSSWSR